MTFTGFADSLLRAFDVMTIFTSSFDIPKLAVARECLICLGTLGAATKLGCCEVPEIQLPSYGHSK